MNKYSKIDEYKNILNKRRPFEGSLLKQLKEYFRIGLTWSSNALEGNSLTLTETKVILEDGLTVGGKPLKDIYEATGHSAAYDFMYSLISGRDITVADIKTMHNLFYKAIDEENAGEWRNEQIIVTGTEYAFPKPEALEEEMQKLGEWIKSERENYHPIDFAALLHLKFVTTHPFIDGNGRVGRLLMNLALLQDKYMLAIVPPILRVEYINAIKRHQLKNNPDSFCEFIGERVLETEKEIIRLFNISLEDEQSCESEIDEENEM
jgi:Fic family protein